MRVTYDIRTGQPTYGLGRRKLSCTILLRTQPRYDVRKSRRMNTGETFSDSLGKEGVLA